MPRKPVGTGAGGKTYNDLILAAKVRTQLLNDMYEILTESDKAAKFGPTKLGLIFKIAPTALPRLNEHTGKDGGNINISLSKLLDAADEADTG